MIPFGRIVRRKTREAYRFTVSGAIVDKAGRQLVVELVACGKHDLIRIREFGRRDSSAVEIDPVFEYQERMINKVACKYTAGRSKPK